MNRSCDSKAPRAGADPFPPVTGTPIFNPRFADNLDNHLHAAWVEVDVVTRALRRDHPHLDLTALTHMVLELITEARTRLLVLTDQGDRR